MSPRPCAAVQITHSPCKDMKPPLPKWDRPRRESAQSKRPFDAPPLSQRVMVAPSHSGREASSRPFGQRGGGPDAALTVAPRLPRCSRLEWPRGCRDTGAAATEATGRSTPSPPPGERPPSAPSRTPPSCAAAQEQLPRGDRGGATTSRAFVIGRGGGGAG